MMRWTGLPVLLFIIISEVTSSAKFKLELLEFSNRNGLLNDETCCAGQLINSACTQGCTTFFKVCLKPYQETITPGECAFGEYTTPILGNNSITFSAQQASFANPMEFPIGYSWPGDFTLIIEALHEPTPAAEELIARFKGSSLLAPPDGWKEMRWNTSHALASPSLSFKYQIECDENFYGRDCAKACSPRDDELGHYECDEEGNKLCRQGWQGEYCDKAICLDGCSKEHGECSRPNECSCRVGWKGRLCDECSTYPGCTNGYCEVAWQCKCYEGWGGLYCNQDLNYCTHNRPCQNGGTCTNTGEGSYTCACPIGHSGVNCEYETDNCMNAPCLNGGECKDVGNDYVCECPAGFSGSRCHTTASRCEQRPCANGATCEPVGSSYRCHCPSGWTGVNCVQEVNECLTVDTPCHNGGRCVDELGTYSCVCQPGFSGDFCEVDEDECAGNNPCLNGGQCINGNNRYSCRCRPGFIGDLCETDVDECATRPCANGGSCEDRVNDFVCHCAAGYTGRMCTEQKNECDVDVCKNGATCEDHVNGYECHCTPDFTGTHCEERKGTAVTTQSTSTTGNPLSASTPAQPELNVNAVSNGASRSEPSSDLQLTEPQLIMIISIASGVPMLLLFILVTCLLCRRRQRRRAHADKSEEAKQNEINGMNNRIHNAVVTSGGKADLYEYPTTEKKVVDETPAPVHQIPLHYRNSAACQPSTGKLVHKEMIKDINRAKELQLLCKSNTSVAPAQSPLTSARQQYPQYYQQDKLSNVSELTNRTNASNSIATVCDAVLLTEHLSNSNNSSNNVYTSETLSPSHAPPGSEFYTVCDV